MAIDPKQERYIRSFYPGLIEDIVALGAGDFVAEPEKLKLKVKGAGLKGVAFRLTYKLADGYTVELRVASVLKAGVAPWAPATPMNLSVWERDRYALHYGETFDDCTFRFDLDEIRGHHVHIRPRPQDHVPTEDVTPDVRDLDPREFIKKVKAYRDKNVYPVRKLK